MQQKPEETIKQLSDKTRQEAIAWDLENINNPLNEVMCTKPPKQGKAPLTSTKSFKQLNNYQTST